MNALIAVVALAIFSGQTVSDQVTHLRILENAEYSKVGVLLLTSALAANNIELPEVMQGPVNGIYPRLDLIISHESSDLSKDKYTEQDIDGFINDIQYEIPTLIWFLGSIRNVNDIDNATVRDQKLSELHIFLHRYARKFKVIEASVSKFPGLIKNRQAFAQALADFKDCQQALTAYKTSPPTTLAAKQSIIDQAISAWNAILADLNKAHPSQ